VRWHVAVWRAKWDALAVDEPTAHAAGTEVIVANARSVRLISESSRKDDKLDAGTLARLVRIDPQLLSPIRHRSEQAQADLMSIRARAALVEMRTGLINTARGLVSGVNYFSRPGVLIVADQIGEILWGAASKLCQLSGM